MADSETSSKTSGDEFLEYAESFINAVREPLIVLDHDLRVISASRSFLTICSSRFLRPRQSARAPDWAWPRSMALSSRTTGLSMYTVSPDTARPLKYTCRVMPEINGRDFVNQINTLYPDMKTLFMSGYTDDVIVRHGILEKGVRYIQKPFSITDLGTKVRKAIEA